MIVEYKMENYITSDNVCQKDQGLTWVYHTKKNPTKGSLACVLEYTNANNMELVLAQQTSEKHFRFTATNKLIDLSADQHIYEVIPETFPRLHYLDFDLHREYQEPFEKVFQYSQTCADYAKSHDPATSTDFIILDASTENKVSYHTIFEFGFKNLADHRQFMHGFEKHVNILKLEFIHDSKIYTRNRYWRCVNQSKFGMNNPLKTVVGSKDFRSTLVTQNVKHILQVLPVIDMKSYEKGQIINFQDITCHIDLNDQSVPDYTKKDCMDFILSCIPNKHQPFKIWWYVGMIIKACNGSVKQWIDWSNKCTEYGDQTEACKSFWAKMVVHDESPTILSLKFLARKYQPDILFDKTNPIFNIFSLQTAKNRFNNFETYDSEYVKPYPIQEFDCVVERARMGGGKTEQVIKVIQDLNPTRILFLSPRIAFANNIAGRFAKFGLQSYTSLSNDEMPVVDRIVMSIESLWKLGNANDYDLIVMDESEACLAQLSSPTCTKQRQVQETLIYLFSHANKIIVLDAFMTSKTIRFLEKAISKEKRVIIRKNIGKPKSRQAIDLTQSANPLDSRKSKENLLAQLMKSLRNGKKCLCVSSSKDTLFKYIEHINKELPHIKIWCCHSDADVKTKAELCNVNETWIKYDLVIYTSSITVGVNFDLAYFDQLFLIISGYACSVRDIFQASYRSRSYQDNLMYYVIIPYRSDLILPVDLEEVKKNELAKCPNVVMPEWYFDVNCYNILDINVSRRFTRLVTDFYLQLTNYKPKLRYCLDDDPIVYELQDDPPFDSSFYRLAPRYHTDDQYETLRKEIRESPHCLELRESLAWNIFQDKLDPEVKVSFDDKFNAFVIYRNHNKRELMINYNLERMWNKTIEERIQQALNDHCYPVLMEQRLRLVPQIKSVCNRLGVTSSHDIKAVINADIFKDSDVIDFITLFKNVFYLRSRRKNQSLADPIFAKDCVSQIFQKWSGSKLVSQRVRDGKERKWIYRFDPTNPYNVQFKD